MKKYLYAGNWTPQYDVEDNAGIFVFEYEERADQWIKIQFVRTGYSVSWMKIDKEKQLLYVCLETKKYLNNQMGGRILWYHIDNATGKLRFVNMCNSLGAYPIAMSWQEDFCLVLNHGSNLTKNCEIYRDSNGQIKTRYQTDEADLVLFSRDDLGNLLNARDFYSFQGKGTLPFFQETASPHSLFGDDNLTYFVPERGTDKITYFRVDLEQMKIYKMGEIIATKEYGPRNVVVSKNGENCYLIPEVEAKLIFYKRDKDGVFSFAEERDTVAKQEIKKIQEPKTSFEYPHPVDIAMSKDGRFLYTLTRTANTLGIFTLNKKEGNIENEKFIVLDGENPRQLVLTDSGIYVVFQNSRKIQKLILDDEKEKVIGYKDIICDIDNIAVMELFIPDLMDINDK